MKVTAMSDLVKAEASLIAVALDAPIMAVLRRWPKTTHAVTFEAIIEGWWRGTFTSACGIRSLRLVGHDGLAARWPPKVKHCPYVRCRECWVATGKRRPRTRWVSNKGKVCTRCGKFRNWAEYPQHKFTKDGKQSWCRGCKTQGMRDLRAKVDTYE